MTKAAFQMIREADRGQLLIDAQTALDEIVQAIEDAHGVGKGAAMTTESADGDPVQLLGEKFRIGVLDVVLAVLETPEFKAASIEDRVQAELAGLMLGFCAALQSMSQPEGHAELRSLIIEHLPTYFDDAREGGGLPRLGSARADLSDDSYQLQHRLQSVIGGLEANEAVNGLTNVLTVLMLTSCATKEDAKRSALMVGETVRKRVLERWNDQEFADTRRKLQAEARGRMN